MPRDFAAGFVVYRTDIDQRRSYLVIKNTAGHWELPKGHPKADETWIQTALRELTEETGIADASPIAGFARQIEYVFRDRQNRLVHKRVCFALTATQKAEITLSHEHLDSTFLPFEAATKQLTHASTRAVLRDAEKFLSRE